MSNDRQERTYILLSPTGDSITVNDIPVEVFFKKAVGDSVNVKESSDTDDDGEYYEYFYVPNQ